MKTYPYRIKIALDALVAALLLAIGAIGGHYYTKASAPAITEQWTTSQPAPQVAAVPTQKIKPKAVKVYAPKAKQKLELPPEIQNDPNLYVLQSSRLPANAHPATLTTIFDEKSGEVQTYVRHEPLPWFATESTGEARIDYGIKAITGTVARLTVRQDLLQVKALHAGLSASLDGDGQAFIGIGVGWRW